MIWVPPSSLYWWSGLAAPASSSSTASSTGLWSPSLALRTWISRMSNAHTLFNRRKPLLLTATRQYWDVHAALKSLTKAMEGKQAQKTGNPINPGAHQDSCGIKWILSWTFVFCSLCLSSTFCCYSVTASGWRSSSAGWALTTRLQGISFTDRWPLWAAASAWATP